MKYRVRMLPYVVVLLVLALVAAACSKPAESNSSAGEQEGEKILISGLENIDMEISVEELKALQSVTLDATSVDSAGNENSYTVTGPLFDDLLKKYGKSQSNLQGIRLVAGDGYSIEVPAEVLKSRDIILTHTINGKPLDEKSRPIRAVIPGERAMYWVRNLTRVEVLEGIQQAGIDRVFILETMISQSEVEDYTYYESTDKAVKVAKLLEILDLAGESGTAFFKASDGFEKNERLDIFSKGYIKYTGNDAPLFLSPDLPKGMYIKNIVLYSIDSDVVMSQEKAMELLGEEEMEGNKGVSLKKFIQEAGLADADKYLLGAADGYIVEILNQDMEKGIVYKDDKGRVAVCFDGLPKNTRVKDLLSIQRVK